MPLSWSVVWRAAIRNPPAVTLPYDAPRFIRCIQQFTSPSILTVFLRMSHLSWLLSLFFSEASRFLHLCTAFKNLIVQGCLERPSNPCSCPALHPQFHLKEQPLVPARYSFLDSFLGGRSPDVLCCESTNILFPYSCMIFMCSMPSIRLCSIYAEDNVRCGTSVITQVPGVLRLAQREQKSLCTAKVKANLILIFSMNTNHESVASILSLFEF